MTADIISPSEIQSELNRIWESLEGTNKTRASLFNLIFFTKKKGRAEYIRTIAQSVIEKFPSRVIFITEESPSTNSYLNTRVEVISPNGSADIACDFIQIDVSGPLKEKVPFVLLPHILPDLPIYVIWSEDPSEHSPLFTELQSLATRFIFDSESIKDLCSFANTLLNFEKTFHCDIADLNWARIENWRLLLASTFYSEERLNTLKQATQIQIVYNTRETATYHTQFQPLYLQGWLATQLGWKLLKSEMKDHQVTLRYQKEKGEVTVTLYPEFQEKLKAGMILSVDLETEAKAHFSFGCNLEIPHHVSMRFSTLEKCDIPLRYIFTKEESGQSLVKEISHRGTSQHFLNLLKNITSQKGMAPCAS